MKTCLIVLASLSLFTLKAFSQTITHHTIMYVKASYRSLPTSSLSSSSGSGPNIPVKSTLEIQLRDSVDAVKLYVKMIDKQSGASLYQVNYPLGSADVASNGQLLFSRRQNTVLVSNPNTVSLKPYVYELYTEDAAGLVSPLYTIQQ